MTNPTPHGQVPEALIDLIDAYAETRHRCGRIHNAETEGARNAVIEALSEVQALSAAPEAFLKSVIALCSHRGYSPANIEAWDKYDKWIADLWRQAESMLAASPTPPAEQQAMESVLVDGVAYPTPAPVAGELLRLHLELLQAAPKAAPVTQQAGYAEVIECGNSYAKVKLKGEAFGSTKVGDIFYTAPQPAPDCHHRPPCDECAAIAAQRGNK